MVSKTDDIIKLFKTKLGKEMYSLVSNYMLLMKRLAEEGETKDNSIIFEAVKSELENIIVPHIVTAQSNARFDDMPFKIFIAAGYQITSENKKALVFVVADTMYGILPHLVNLSPSINERKVMVHVYEASFSPLSIEDKGVPSIDIKIDFKKIGAVPEACKSTM